MRVISAQEVAGALAERFQDRFDCESVTDLQAAVSETDSVSPALPEARPQSPGSTANAA